MVPAVPVLNAIGLTAADAAERLAMAAFVAVFIAVGWRPGDGFPTGPSLLAASGAAFTAVVLGQAANTFACRSTTVPAWRIPLRRNRLLLGAVAAELAMLAAFLYVPPLADLLGMAPPTPAGFAVGLLAIPAVLLADRLHKAAIHRRHPRAVPKPPGNTTKSPA